MKQIALLIAAAVLVPLPALAADLTEQQARLAAAKIIAGDPYGKTANDALKSIRGAKLLPAGTMTDCVGKLRNPMWELRVFVPKEKQPPGESDIDGIVGVDARSGKRVCTMALPFVE